jgi:hypothetical protein
MHQFEIAEENRRLFHGYTIQRTNPYGLWIILDSKSRTPKGLDGSFTTPQDAAKVVKNYIDNQKKS